MIRKIMLGSALSLLLLPTAHAETPEETVQFGWMREPSIVNGAKVQLGIGLLDDKFNGNRGAVITSLFGVDYIITDDFSLQVGLPLAGTFSFGPDNFGIGNVTVGGKYRFPVRELSFVAGLELALPSAQNRAVVGASTRYLTQFVDNQFGLSPYLIAAWTQGKLTLSADLGLDVQIFTDTPAGFDDVEMLLSYDVGVAHALHPNVRLTLEFGGYSTLTWANNQTELFAGPGIRYQDNEIAAGFHFMAPFRSPTQDVIDFMGLVDFRVFF